MNKTACLFLLLFTLLAASLCTLLFDEEQQNAHPTLLLYCAPSFQDPITEIVSEYEQATGTRIKVVYNGSGALLSQIKIGGGDLYLPANMAYVDDASSLDLIQASEPLTTMTAVIVVRSENSNIRTLQDLCAEGVRISFASRSAAIGRFTRQVLDEHQLLPAVSRNAIVTKLTVNAIIEDVALGSADVTIAWAPVVRRYPQLKSVTCPALEHRPSRADIALLKSSNQPQKARHFIRYLTHPEHGQRIFEKYHFRPALSDS